MIKVLIIDDDKMLCEMLSLKIRNLGYSPKSAHTIAQGLKEVLSNDFDVVFLDVRLPDGSGLHVIQKILAAPSSPEVFIITGESDPDGAEMAISSGAWDYIEKPLSTQALTLQLNRALQYRQEKISGNTPVLLNREEIIGESEHIKSCLKQVAKAAKSSANVLITGETGTGKELFARAIHENSPRAENNFVVVDCGAITETLVGSILFGHEKGAFTGAVSNQLGLIKQADKGTLFLDEVGELPLTMQSSFLRVLQEHRVRPLGGKEEIKSDFRLVVATNRDLNQMVQIRKFRNDLLFRIQTVTINLPPLRKRKKDIKNLAVHYTGQFCDRYELGTKGFSPEFFEILESYNWPGNVRELSNAMEEAVSSAQNESTLFPIHLPPRIRVQMARNSASIPVIDNNSIDNTTKISGEFPKLKLFIETTERQYLYDLMAFTKGNTKEACRISGLSRSRMYDRLKKYDIPKKF